MSDCKVGTRPWIKMFTILAMCLGVMAIGASSAAASEPPYGFNFTGVAHNAFIYTGGNGGTKCETLTVKGTAVQQPAPYPKTGLVSSLASTNCINQFWNTKTTFSLASGPWSMSFNGNTGTLTNFNMHLAWTEAAEAVHCDIVGGTKAVAQNQWNFVKSDPMTVKNPSGGSIGAGVCKAGPGYVEANFVVSYVKDPS